MGQESVELINRLAEEFANIPPKIIEKNRINKCSKCKWRGSLNGSPDMTMLYCNWAEMNGKRFRDCLPTDCKYFEKGRKKRSAPKGIRASRRMKCTKGLQ